MAEVLTGAFHIVAVVAAVGGVAKVLRPDEATAMLAGLGLPRRRVVARTAGLVELAVGVAALAFGGAAAAGLLAGLYVVLAVVAAAARRSGAASCGCFGAAASPPGPVHVVVNGVSAAVAAGAAVAGVAPAATVLADQPLAGVPYLSLVALGAWAVVVVDTTGATVLSRMGEVRGLDLAAHDHGGSR